MKPFRKKTSLLLQLLLCSSIAFAQLQANFTADKTGGCSPIAVAFTNTTTGASANAVYTWNLGNGNTAVAFNAGAIYTEEKTYTVTLTVTDGDKTASKTQTVTVYSKPTVDFTATPVKGCLPVPVTFTANAAAGSGYIASYHWDFGDGNTQQTSSSTQTHTYTIPQKATVSLTVSNNFGCTKTIQKPDIIEIIPTLRAGFSASQTILCRETDPVQFTNTSSGPGTLSYLWDFGDATTSTDKTPLHVFNKKGIYTVKLTVTSSEGCVTSSTQAGYINVATFNSNFSGPQLICRGSYVTLNSNSTPYSNNTTWEVDGTPAGYFSNYLSYTFNTAGSHTIKLRNVFGTCPDSVTNTVDVKEPPVPNGFKDTILAKCGAPVNVRFEDTTAGAVKWAWNFNANYNYNATDAITQQPTYTYTQDGTYLVRLTVENAAGCTAVTTKYVGITRPSVYITSTGTPVTCGSYTMKFTANTTEEITSYNWVFSDGATSTDMQPEHLFATEGINSVQLTYVTKNGCTGTVSIGGMQVYRKPTAAFTASATTICGNTPVSFNAIPQADVRYVWYLGDNPSPYFNFSNPSLIHQYYTDDTYSIKLIVYNGGCADTVIKTNYITILPPIPRINAPVNTCDGTRGTVTVTQNSIKANSLLWDFGDGNSSTVNAPSIQHTYDKTGTYKIVLSATNGQCTVRDSTFTTVLLKQSPLLTASSANICENNRVDIQIANLERNPRGDTYSNHYNISRVEYGDGSLFGGYLTNNFSGNYWSTIYNGYMSNFDRTKKDLRIILRSYFFNCADTTNIVPLVINGVQAGFEIITDNVCFKSPVVLRDTSKSFGINNMKTWTWNFGDGFTQTVTQSGQVSHIYASPGNYYVSLTVTDNGGCAATSGANVRVNGPKAAFSPSSTNTTITLPVYFYNYTNTFNSPGTQYQWNFGDAATSTDYSPTHAYANPGTYTIRLIAINPATQCADTSYQTITVNNFKPAFTVTTTYLGAKSCPPVLARFTNNSINYTRVTWDFGDGITADNLNFPAHVYENAGRYLVTLYVYGPSGLTATHKDSVIINQPEAVMQTNSALEACIGHTVMLTSITKNANLYAWDFGDGTLSTPGDSITTHQYNKPGTYKPALMVTQTGGCAAHTTLPDQIVIRPKPTITLLPQQPIACKGTPISITATGGNSYAWSPATGLNDATIASPMATPDVTTTYTVLVKDNLGCSNTDSIKVKVVTPLTVTASADTFVCKGNMVQLRATGADLYTWIDNTTGLSNTQVNNPIASPVITTNYTVVGTDMYHCFTDTITINVRVIPLPTVTASPGVLVFPSTPVQLSATTSSDVLSWKWSPATYLNCSACLTPTSTPLSESVYTITVKTQEGCTASDSTVIKLICEESRVSIPTAFTPNTDGKNDVFIIKGIAIVKHLIIYNRWGNKVYERSNFVAADRSACWNGTVNGTPAPAGVYVYFAELQCPTGASFVRKGNVILTR